METALILKGYVRELERRINECRSKYGDEQINEKATLYCCEYKDTEEVENLEIILDIIEDDIRDLKGG